MGRLAASSPPEQQVAAPATTTTAELIKLRLGINLNLAIGAH